MVFLTPTLILALILTISLTLTFSLILEKELMIMGSVLYLDPWNWMPLVPTVALLSGLALNLFGNILGVMPLD
jgi:hypothetical protein